MYDSMHTSNNFKVFCGNDKGTLFRIDVGSGTVTEHTFEEVYSK